MAWLPVKFNKMSPSGKDFQGLIEPPTPQLIKTLLDLKLCSMADIRRCRSRVKRLARDLPAFDSIWIDALLQARRLTPFQAELLDSPERHRLCVGPCVLVDQLGYRTSSNTFLARQLDGNERCTLKLIECAPEVLSATLACLKRLTEKSKETAHPSIVAPRTAHQSRNKIALVSRFVPGPHLDELLVRRGRFPATIVTDLAGQLIDGLATMEQYDLVHGNIQLSNVRLTSHGVAVLVDFGVQPAVSPEFTIHSKLSLSACDGTAPELIGTGNRATSASDLYALGCLLWQLLAGRPPFPTGDPLAKLAAHQTQRIDDVREIAPDVPAFLAEAITSFTNPDLDQRPHSFREVREQWPAPRRSGRNRLSKFSSLFNTSARRIPVAAQTTTASKWPLLLVFLFVLSGATLTLLDKGASSLPLTVRNLTLDLFGDASSESAQPTTGHPKNEKGENQTGLLSLPIPDAGGLILLDSNGPYLFGRIDAVGPLSIRGVPHTRPIILIGDKPALVVADQLSLENIHFRRKQSASENVSTRSLLKVRVQNLAVHNCSFVIESPSPFSAEPGEPISAIPAGPAMLEWQAVDEQDQSGGHLDFQNTFFQCHSPAMFLTSLPSKFVVKNCLKQGVGPFATLASAPRPQQTFHAELNRLTLRESGALLQIAHNGKSTQSGLIAIYATDCVFHLSQNTLALLQFVANRDQNSAKLRVEVVGEGTLANRNFEIATWTNSQKSTTVVLLDETITLEGISAAPFEFASQIGLNPHDSSIQSFRAPSRSALPPGITAKLFLLPETEESSGVH